MTEYRSLLTEDDVVSANRLWLRWRRSWKYWSLLFAFVVVVVFAVGIAPKLNRGDGTAIVRAFAFAIGWAAIAISTVIGLNYVLAPRHARKLFRQNKSLHLEAMIGWSDEGFSYKSSLASGLQPWGHYRAWTENKDVLVMFLTDNMFNIVPKRDIPKATLEELKNLLTNAGIQRVGKQPPQARKPIA